MLAFDLNNYDALVHRHVLPDEFVRKGASLFVTPVVDVRGPTCQNTMVYMADVNGFAIIVYDVARGRSWRVHNKYVYPHPYYGTFKIAGESFELMDGVLGMAVSPKSLRTERSLYFHALTGISENKVPLSVLDNEAAWRNNPDASPRSFVVRFFVCNEGKFLFFFFVNRKLVRVERRVQRRPWTVMVIYGLV